LTITPDIDTITLAVETTKNALKRALVVKPTEIGAVYVGSPVLISLIP
jgi:3-hydroxy-3-methylglutaryl CoA synthase